MKKIYFKTIDSTNLYIKNHYQELKQFSVVFSDMQTSGRGRRERTWISQEGSLSLSMLLKPDKKDVSILSLVVGCAVLKVIQTITPAKLKWPNDIMIEDKKVVGILLEGIATDKTNTIIAGIGINVNQDSFPDDISSLATSLKMITGSEFDKKEIVNKVANQIKKEYKLFNKGNYSFIKYLNDNSYLNSKTAYVGNEEIKIIKILRNGKLLIETKQGLREKNSGEISLHNNYGKILK